MFLATGFRAAATREQFIKVVDLEGHELGTYADSLVQGKATLGLAFACYTVNPERFTFLAVADDNTLELRIAEQH